MQRCRRAGAGAGVASRAAVIEDGAGVALPIATAGRAAGAGDHACQKPETVSAPQAAVSSQPAARQARRSLPESGAWGAVMPQR